MNEDPYDIMMRYWQSLIIICWTEGHVYNRIIMPDDSVIIFEPQCGWTGYLDVAKEIIRWNPLIVV